MKSVAIFLAGMLALAAAIAAYFFYQTRVGGYEPSPEIERNWALGELRSAVQQIEVYRLVFGNLPNSLEAMRGGVSYYDSFAEQCACGDSNDFYYSLSDDGNTYQLFSRGPDCKAFTPDDLAPELTDIERSKIGWRDATPSPIAQVATVEACDGA